MKTLAAILFCTSIIYLIHKFYIHFIHSSSTFVKLFIQKGHHEIATFSSKLIFYRLEITFPSTNLHIPGYGKTGYFTLGEWSHKKGKWISLIYLHTGAKSRAFCPGAKRQMFLVKPSNSGAAKYPNGIEGGHRGL